MIRLLVALILFPFFSWANCEPERVATASMLLELCQKDRSYCQNLVKYFNRAPNFRVSINGTSVEPQVDGSIGSQSPVIMPYQPVKVQFSNNQEQLLRHFATMRVYDSSKIHRGPITIDNYRIFLDPENGFTAYGNNEIKKVMSLTSLADQRDLLTQLLSTADISFGKKILYAGEQWTIEKVQGHIVDKTGDYVYVRVNNQVVKKPLGKVIQTISSKAHPQFVATARSIARGSSKIRKLLLTTPIGAALDLTLSPTMAACSDLASAFVDLCSGDSARFKSWFRRLDVYDRKQAITKPEHCEVINNYIKTEVDKLSGQSESVENQFERIWSPENVVCDDNGNTFIQFDLKHNILDMSQPVNDRSNYRYYVDMSCDNYQKRVNCFDRISTRRYSRERGKALGATRQLILKDQAAEVHFSSSLNNRLEISGPISSVEEGSSMGRLLVDKILMLCRTKEGGIYNHYLESGTDI